MKGRSAFGNLLREVYLHVLGVVVLFLFTFYLIIFIPGLIIRPIVSFLQPYIRPDLAGILTRPATAWAQTDLANSPSIVIQIQLWFKGDLNYEKFVKLVENRMVRCKGEDGIKWRYPELQKYVVNWAGFKFWKWEEKFDVRDHVKMSGDSKDNIKSEEDLNHISTALLCNPFEEKKSPWDITLVPGVLIEGDMCTAVIFRIHHCLADGFSAMFLLQRLMGVAVPGITIAAKYSRFSLGYFIKLPFKIVRMFGELSNNAVSNFLWSIQPSEKSLDWSATRANKISIPSIQKIKRHFGVNFSAVVFSLLSGGMQRYIERNEGEKGKRTLELPCAVTVPVKSHPDKLVNRFSFAIFNFPIMSITDPLERLRKINSDFEGMRNSPVPLIGYWIINLHGSNFNFIGKVINSIRYAPAYVTYFPFGTDKDWTLLDCQGKEWMFEMKVQMGTVGAVYCISSYQNVLRISPSFNSKLKSKEELDELCRDIEQEVDMLLKAVEAEEKKCQ